MARAAAWMLLGTLLSGCFSARMSPEDCEALCKRQGSTVTEYRVGVAFPIFRPFPPTSCACAPHQISTSLAGNLVLAGDFLPMPLLGPPSAHSVYGPGIYSDATGQPFQYRDQATGEAIQPLETVRPDAYGPGVGMGQYGEPVVAEPDPDY